jgi:hypothetical protein
MICRPESMILSLQFFRGPVNGISEREASLEQAQQMRSKRKEVGSPYRKEFIHRKRI